MKFTVINYKQLRSAHLEVKGITFLYSRNASGKSTVIAALKSLIGNRFSPSSFSHSTKELKLILELGEHKVEMFRDDSGSTSLSYNDEPPLTKLGRNSLNTLVPFPLKNIPFTTSFFYPNIIEQNAVPVLSDVSVYELFSSMFLGVAQISEAVSETKISLSEAVKKGNEIKGALQNSKFQCESLTKDIDELLSKNPDLDDKIWKLGEIEKKISLKTDLNLMVESTKKQILHSPSETLEFKNLSVLLGFNSYSDILDKRTVFTQRIAAAKKAFKLTERLKKVKIEKSLLYKEFEPFKNPLITEKVKKLLQSYHQLQPIQRKLEVARGIFSSFSSVLIQESSKKLLSHSVRLKACSLKKDTCSSDFFLSSRISSAHRTMLESLQCLKNIQKTLYDKKIKFSEIEKEIFKLKEELSSEACSPECPLKELVTVWN